MNIHRIGREWLLHTPAKVNLFFEVIGKRSDGFHEIETLMCPIGLFDTVYFTEREDDEIRFSCRLAGTGYQSTDTVPGGDENLAVRAVKSLRDRANIRRGADVLLVKRIPAAAGLGGGSSDAAAALSIANVGWRLGLSRTELADIGAQLGSDVPFFLFPGAAVCRGRGERIEPIVGPVGLPVVVTKPPEGISTATVYRACKVPAVCQSIGPIVDAYRRGDARELGRLLHNRLQETAEELAPCITKLARRYSRGTALGHGMSGSGTAYFGLFHTHRQAMREERLQRADGAAGVFAVCSCR